MAWGPYLWTDGTNGRSDGLIWECADVEAVGIHPSESGELKAGTALLDHFTTDPTASSWFAADVPEPSTTTTTTTATTLTPTTTDQPNVSTTTSPPESAAPVSEESSALPAVLIGIASGVLIFGGLEILRRRRRA